MGNRRSEGKSIILRNFSGLGFTARVAWMVVSSPAALLLLLDIYRWLALVAMTTAIFEPVWP